MRYLAFAFLLPLFFAACTEPCKDINCENGGVCIDGRCDCPTGYTGIRCEVKLDPCIALACVNADTCLVDNQGQARCICSQGYEGIRCDSLWTEKYLGTYEVAEECGFSTGFTVDVVPGPRFGEVTIANFHNEAGTGGTAKVVVQVLTRNAVFIPEQFMHFGKVTGNGGFGPGPAQFNLEYTIIQNTDTSACFAVFNRR